MRIPTKLVRSEWPPNDGVLPGNIQFDILFESIKNEGIKKPITINLNWFVIDGMHRLSAARILNINYIDVIIWTGTEFLT